MGAKWGAGCVVLNVEAEFDDITVLNFVFLAFDAEFTGLSCFGG